MSGWEATTLTGLAATLDNPKVPVSKQCQAVEDCIVAHSDNLRGFFEQCFPTLLKRLFGYDGSSWLTLVARSPKEADAKALLKLLSPTGVLFTAMYNADADGSTQFFFPKERLPTHTQMLLASPAGRAELGRWPQYARGAVVTDSQGRCHVKLGVFQFFIFWFAFYVIRGDSGGGDAQGGAYRTQGAGLTQSVRKAADLMHLTRGGRDSEDLRHPYLAALRSLLLELLPRPTAAGGLGGGARPAQPAGPRFHAAALRQAEGPTRGAAFLSILLEFWTTDGDEPVPLAPDGGGNSAPRRRMAGAGLWGTTYEPPSEDLLEALAELAKYVVVAVGPSRGRQPAQAGPPWLPPTQLHTLLPPAAAGSRGGGAASVPSLPHIAAGPSRLGAAAQPAAQAFARRLYRFFRRALALWPQQRSIKPLVRCFLAYVAPWQDSSAAPSLAPGSGVGAAGHGHLASHLTAQVTDLVHRVHWADGGGRGGSTGSYDSQWENHVLSNLPFYLALLPLFLEMSVPRVEVRGESAAQDLLNVLGVLEAAPELRERLKEMETNFNKFAASQPQRAQGADADLLPWLLEQAQDWEAAGTANCAGDTPLVRSTPSFTLFSTAAGGAACVARDLLDLSSHIFRPEVQRRLRSCLEASLPLVSLPAAAGDTARAVEAAQYEEAVPRLPKSSWRDARYHGDPMLRPIAAFEVGLLVRLLVALSARINAALGLDRWQPAADNGEEAEAEAEPAENRLQELLARMRRRGVRVDLRPLADVRNLAWIPILGLLGLHTLRFLTWLVAAVVTGAAEGGAAGRHGRQQHLHGQGHS